MLRERDRVERGLRCTNKYSSSIIVSTLLNEFDTFSPPVMSKDRYTSPSCIEGCAHEVPTSVCC